MNKFEDFKIKKQLKKAIADLGFIAPTPIQQKSYSPILGGADFVGIAQTGTGKTIAYLLPILQDLKFSDQPHPRVLILAPTRELVIQIVEQIEKLTPYMSIRVVGVYGGSNNIDRQKRAVAEGQDIVVGTPRRLYDLALSNVLRLKSIKKLVIDEVDVMLDFGYKTQLKNIFGYLPEKRQNILFSATMTTYVDELMTDFLVNPIRKTIAISGTPLENISQETYTVPNFYTKVNLLNHLLKDKEEYSKVLIFVASKVNADRLAEVLDFESEISVIHSSKEQNHRIKSIDKFEKGTSRILIATDVIARGIDIEKISTVISFDTPFYPENYIHRIGRTGRAGEQGRSILFYNEKEEVLKDAIESLMNYKIPFLELPKEVEVSTELTPEEEIKPIDPQDETDTDPGIKRGASFHAKSAKNSKERAKEKSYERKIKQKYKKPQKRGDKIQNKKRKNKR
ncbi:DEAD/DEAH box helicase [Maribacter sp. ANRC-HE7]|uniref:DEAD/DEAH box helicase n=1 Tax=Maribacter aquimaris TaxID=2737171 RepID=A0ABR7UZA7_9FLAO|nr:DEAD/DEAH box helicase [Maribacter aquimaris]MBD0777929.1 DEAD/DEAH box helicase [Maribacter aquimaris]